MSLPVKLQDVLIALEPMGDEWYAYIHRHTGELITFSEEEMRLAEEDDPQAPEWQLAQLPDVRKVLASNDYVELPDAFAFDEYHVMERFCWQQDDAERREELLSAIRGRGAFRRFKDVVYVKGMADDWFAYRERALKELAMDFLEDEGIPFVES